MNTVACIRTFGAGVIISTSDDNQVTEEKIPDWRPYFFLNKAQEKLFLYALHSNRGHKILQNLKNERANGVINVFLENYRKTIGKGKHLESFVNNVIEQPLLGKNLIRLTTIGITKQNIWDAFIKEGLIKLKT